MSRSRARGAAGILVLFALLLSSTRAAGEGERGVPPSEGVGRVSFDLVEGRIVLPVRVGDSGDLGVILDTGVSLRGVYLFHREAVDEIGIPELVEVLLPGPAGDPEPSRALRADSMALVCGDMTLRDQTVVISMSDATQGFEWDGVLGYAFFGSYAVEIDYEAQLIRLYDPGAFPADSSWARVGLDLGRGVPFFEAAVSVDGDHAFSAAIYADLADPSPLTLLVRKDMKFHVPSGVERVRLGAGPGGDVHGGVGVVSRLGIGPFTLRDVPTVFAPAEWRTRQPGADGVLGGGALSRFDVVFDYAAATLYLRPNDGFAEPFTE